MASTFQNLAQNRGALNVTSPGSGGAPSCKTCPAFLDPMKQTSVLGKGIGGDMCGKLLIAIGRPGKKDADRDATKIAASCKEYGQPTAYTQGSDERAIEIRVAFPDPVALSAPKTNQEDVSSCYRCVNYVPERMTEAATGWRAGFCRAKGTLMLPDRLSKYAKDCDSRSYTITPLRDGNIPPADWQLQLLPEHADPINPNDPLLKLKNARQGKTHDPRTYNFPEKKVSDAAKALGIRTWMPVNDQTGYGPRVWLPVFDLHKMSDQYRPVGIDWDLEEELSKVPQEEDADKPHRYVDWANLEYDTTISWIKFNEVPALWGPAGVGKTEFFRYMGWKMQLPFERISITNRTDVDDIIGKMLYSKDRGTYFHFGRFTRAWAKPCVLCVDEPNTGQPEIWQAIRSTTDNSKQLVLDQDKGQRMPSHKAGYMGMAMNPAWDPLNLGALEVADPDMSRIVHTYLELPPREIEVGIILQHVLDLGWEDNAETKARINTLMKIADDIRAMSKEGSIPISWGIRNQLKTIKLKPYMPWTRAFARGSADALEPEARESIMNAVRSYSTED